MANNKTFTMLKPDSVEKGNIGAILEKITSSGFRIVAMKLTQLTTADAEAFYAICSSNLSKISSKSKIGVVPL